MSVDYRKSGRELRKKFPSTAKQDHINAGNHYFEQAANFEYQYGKALDEAAQRVWRRPFHVTDYRISGIGSEEFIPAHKDKLRKLAQKITGYKNQGLAHYAAAGRRIETARKAMQRIQGKNPLSARAIRTIRKAREVLKRYRGRIEPGVLTVRKPYRQSKKKTTRKKNPSNGNLGHRGYIKALKDGRPKVLRSPLYRTKTEADRWIQRQLQWMRKEPRVQYSLIEMGLKRG